MKNGLMVGEDYMHKLKLILIVLAIVLSATSFKCIAQAAQVPSFDNHKGYVGTVLEISASEATVEVNRKLAKRPGRRRGNRGRTGGMGVRVVEVNEQKQVKKQDTKKKSDRKKEQDRKKYEEKINKEDWFR